MRRRRTILPRLGRLGAVVWLAPAVAVPTAFGQSDDVLVRPFNSAATSTDAYGNAQFGLPERRPLGIFRYGADAEFGDPTGLGRIRDRRGGDTLFSLPGDVLGLPTIATLANTVSPPVSTVIPRQRVESFRRYGGFGRRHSDPFQDPVSRAFGRRALLMNATSQAAPVYRALAENSSMAGVRSAVVQTPFTPGAEDRTLDAPISLFKRLDARAAALYARTRKEAWGLFSDGAYRLAARAFESVLVLSPHDLEARIGEVFSHLSSGSFRTAVAIVSDLGNHADNVFTADLGMASRFGDPRVAEQLGTDARLALEAVAEGRSPDVDATYILVLWYLGHRDDAAHSALLLAQRPGAAKYGDWPVRMRAIEPNGPQPVETP